MIARSDAENLDRYKRHSMVIVPSDAKGITVDRMLSVYGYDHAPFGHGHLTFENVHVPAQNILLGPGRGFEIMQGRMGPGRIHHAMRCIGAVSALLSLAGGDTCQLTRRCKGREGAGMDALQSQ